MRRGTRVLVERYKGNDSYFEELKFDSWILNQHGVLKAVLIDKNGRPLLELGDWLRVKPKKWWQIWR